MPSLSLLTRSRTDIHVYDILTRRNGERLFLSAPELTTKIDETASSMNKTTTSNSSKPTNNSEKKKVVIEDAIDKQLRGEDGWVKREQTR